MPTGNTIAKHDSALRCGAIQGMQGRIEDVRYSQAKEINGFYFES